ncbi:MAG: 4-alpha-glucanotransferase [Lachnospiraceae bacterium]|nr:4-alpha-glucanotransferase [Lachnospiraceae bacterium]
MRASGILLSISSLATKYGIGGFSKEAYEFVDFLRAAGQQKWQILPLGPTGFGDSPYQSFSTYAGNPYYIDLETLITDGLLTEKECDISVTIGKTDDIDYEGIYRTRFTILRKAFVRFQEKLQTEGEAKECISYKDFCEDNAYWLDDYSLYMALKDKFGGKSWIAWDPDIRNREPKAMASYRAELKTEIAFYQFQQFQFRKQWDALHSYANKNGIEIIGDIPIYVAFDSADTWANPALFQFKENGEPKAVAGCPPDAFSKTGQLWGNPLYDWDYHKKTDYVWWISRISFCLNLYDVIRIDHFRGFDEYYAIPAGDKTAENGHWEKGPGFSLFKKVKEQLGEVNIIAEDLGFLTDTVLMLVADTGFPGMKVLQFAFDSREESDYLPHNYSKNCVVYTGTHDNDTIQGWYQVLATPDKELSIRYMNNKSTPITEIHWDFIRLAMASVADLCIIPLQDYLGLGTEARINVPSTLGTNWRWRMTPGMLKEYPGLAEKIMDMTALYGRTTAKKVQKISDDTEILKK